MKFVLLVVSLLAVSACERPTEIMRHGSYDLKNKIIKTRQSQRSAEAQEMINKANSEFNQWAD